jgi:hypothetical protein
MFINTGSEFNISTRIVRWQCATGATAMQNGNLFKGLTQLDMTTKKVLRYWTEITDAEAGGIGLDADDQQW